ncbi:addiction module antitoxin RelB/DinJ family [Clostridium sp. CAG:354]|nr:type II toxin-antitoxin system RelB/DinJ family antitoxin [Clostridium sp.]MEE0269232.1 type II toxin-antitoxin system RelB/DinJ family antitoxin [Clostridia bacterium]CDE10115.1 addiction module antitoxin RelB/DinJ family [Clostridium sp. CAG:354]
MAKTDTLHIRVEPDVKIKAEETLNDLGLSITEAVNVFLNQVILHDGIPFKIEKPKYNKETIQAMEDVKSGKNLSKTFDSVDEMFEELDK